MTTQKFAWFVDLATDDTKMQVVKVTAGGSQVKKRLLPFFTAYKYYKLGNVSVRFVPAATLPVDPTGLSYEAGESTVDPRDQFNPGLVRITNGEDMAVPAFSSLSENAQMGMYYNMMLDNRWFKFQLQQGFMRNAKPLFWDVGQIHQDATPGAIVNTLYGYPGSVQDVIETDDSGAYVARQARSSLWDRRALYQTGMKEPMGWLPTDANQSRYIQDVAVQEAASLRSLAPVPEVELLTIVLPKAFKTKFYYRVYVEETVHFKDPVIVGFNSYRPLDRSVKPGIQEASPDTISPASAGNSNYPGTLQGGD